MRSSFIMKCMKVIFEVMRSTSSMTRAIYYPSRYKTLNQYWCNVCPPSNIDSAFCVWGGKGGGCWLLQWENKFQEKSKVSATRFQLNCSSPSWRLNAVLVTDLPPLGVDLPTCALLGTHHRASAQNVYQVLGQRLPQKFGADVYCHRCVNTFLFLSQLGARQNPAINKNTPPPPPNHLPRLGFQHSDTSVWIWHSDQTTQPWDGVDRRVENWLVLTGVHP